MKKSHRSETSQQRKQMVDSQIRKRGITDTRLLSAFEAVPRHYFVPPRYMKEAYADKPLPIAMHQTISQPFIVAYMLDCLQLSGNEKILEIGTGSGYQTAILAELVASVYTVEIIPQLAGAARMSLERLQYSNIYFRVGDGHNGWPEFAPYDCVVVSAAPEAIPAALVAQLSDHGRLIIPVGDNDQYLMLIEKGKKAVKQIPVRFVPMTSE